MKYLFCHTCLGLDPLLTLQLQSITRLTPILGTAVVCMNGIYGTIIHIIRRLRQRVERRKWYWYPLVSMICIDNETEKQESTTPAFSCSIDLSSFVLSSFISQYHILSYKMCPILTLEATTFRPRHMPQTFFSLRYSPS